MFRYGQEQYEEGEYVRRRDAEPGDGLDPVVRIVEDLGTVEVPCGKVDCRANCLEYLVESTRVRKSYALTDCKISPSSASSNLVGISASILLLAS